MSNPRYKAVITDIDGTLVQYQPSLSNIAEIDALIPESAITAISRLHAAGIAVAAVTGRTYDQSRDLLIKLGISGPCVFAGGATIRDIPSGEILHEASLNPETLRVVCDTLYEALGKDHYLDLAPSVSDNSRFNSVWAIIHKDHTDKVLSKLSVIDNIYHVVNEGAGQADEVGLLVLSGGADKGSGTRSLLSLLGTTRENTACVGDGANDVLMFQECGLSIAMGNGEEVLKQSADHIVSSIDQDGFAEAADYILQGAFHSVELS
jgi:hydroxymethylpyrimidine pyrophosphatase-like HAD family hydrolase